MQPKFAKIIKSLDAFKASIIKSYEIDEENDTARIKAIEALESGIEYDFEDIEREMENISCKTDEDYDDHDEIQRRTKGLIREAKDRLIELGIDPDQQDNDGDEES